MSVLQQNPDNMVVAGKIKDVLKQRIGSDRFALWFGDRVEFSFDGQRLAVVVDGEFARERLRRHYHRAIESAAAEVLGRLVSTCLLLPAELDAMLGATETAANSEARQASDAGEAARDAAAEEELSDGSESMNPNASDGPIRWGESRLERVALTGRPASRPARSRAAAGGPAPFHQFAIVSATEPRHSQRNTPSSVQAIPTDMQPAFDRNDTPERPASPVGRHRKPPLRSLRVLVDPALAAEAGTSLEQPSSPQAARKSSSATAGRPVAAADRADTGARGAESTESGLIQSVDSQTRAVPTAAAAHAGDSDLSVPMPTLPSPRSARRTGKAEVDSAKSAASSAHSLVRRNEATTFANFVTGTSNTLALTAAQLLASEPIGSTPLCFWGATGTGKTHLLSAIRHELRAKHRLGRVLLMSAEEFTNDFLSCVRGTGLPAFRKRYRDVDAMLIDNVQFLGGKNATVREMMYTIDTILSRRRPLVMAADRPPLEIPGLPSDLAGRMSSGLVCGINPMDLELRRGLLRLHARHSFLPWDEETIELLAQRIPGDGRAIQGVVQMVSMLQRMHRRMPTLDEIVSQAGEMLQRGPKVVALADVDKAICTAFGLTSDELRSDSKSRNVSQPRILAMYLSRQHTTAAFAEIGRYYGDRNHSTVIAAHRRVEDWIQRGQAVGGRGPKNLKVQDAIAAVENLLRIG